MNTGATGPTTSAVQARPATFVSNEDVGRAPPKGDAVAAASRRPLGASANVTVATNLLKRLPPTRDEIAIWRAFLSDEIDAIMRDDE
jgi:hypothetical protein